MEPGMLPDSRMAALTTWATPMRSKSSQGFRASEYTGKSGNSVKFRSTKGVRKLRLAPTIRKDQILEAAVTVATDRGFNKLTRESVAGIAECSVALINTYYSTMTKLRRAVMRVAVKREILPVIAYGLVTGNQQALKASPGLRGRAMSGKLCTDEWARS